MPLSSPTNLPPLSPRLAEAMFPARRGLLAAPARTPTFPLTGEQEAVLDAVHDASPVTVVEALAGTGKTSTLVELAHSFPRRPGTYLAFNKSVAQEAESRFPDWVNVTTAHALAYKAIGRQYGHRLPGNPAASRLGAQVMAKILKAKPLQLDTGTINPVALVRMAQATVNAYLKTDDQQIRSWHLPSRVVGLHDPVAIYDAVVPLARAIWADLISVDGRFRFTHDCYLKMWQLTKPTLPTDYVMFDEAQDADPVIASIVNRQQVQKIYVGDRHQAIYGWRGAIDAMSQIENAVRLPLCKSFRFGPAIAELANEWLANLGSAHRVIGHDPVHSVICEVPHPRAILCRGNGAALNWILKYHQMAVPVALAPGDKNAGKELSRFAWAARDLMKGNGEGTDHPDLVGFTDWHQVCKFVEEEEDADDLERLVNIINRIGVSGVIDAVKGLVTEDKARVTVSTAHKAKGLEWESVLVADDFCIPEMEDEDWRPDPADHMLAYVTVTRAKNRLDPGALGEPRLWR